MLVYLLIGLFVIHVLYRERIDLGCPTNPIGTSCSNKDIAIVRDTRPEPSDPTPTLLKKVDKAANFANRWVTWRLAILLSVPAIILIYYITYQRFPSELELLVGIVVITGVTYYTINYYIYHFIDQVKDNITDSVDILRDRYPQVG
jgi:hypothetical protein